MIDTTTAINGHLALGYLMTGEVPSDADKAAVAQSVSRIENVQSIVDEIAVMPASSFSARSNDTIVTSKVKASLVDAKDVIANAYKVVTERGAVYLLGRVTERLSLIHISEPTRPY